MTTPTPFDVTHVDAYHLEQLVVLALGLQPSFDGETLVACLDNGAPMLLLGDPAASPFLHSFCREWAIGGPLIGHYGISLAYDAGHWHATWREAASTGATPLMAAMGAIVQQFERTHAPLHDFTNLTRLQVLQQLYQPPPTGSATSSLPAAPPSG